MRTRQGILLFLILLAYPVLLAHVPSPAFCAVAVVTHTASGTLTGIGSDDSIILDGKEVFYPVRPGDSTMLQGIRVNSPVTVEYCERDGKKIYIKVLQGTQDIRPSIDKEAVPKKSHNM